MFSCFCRHYQNLRDVPVRRVQMVAITLLSDSYKTCHVYWPQGGTVPYSFSSWQYSGFWVSLYGLGEEWSNEHYRLEMPCGGVFSSHDQHHGVWLVRIYEELTKHYNHIFLSGGMAAYLCNFVNRFNDVDWNIPHVKHVDFFKSLSKKKK